MLGQPLKSREFKLLPVVGFFRPSSKLALDTLDLDWTQPCLSHVNINYVFCWKNHA